MSTFEELNMLANLKTELLRLPHAKENGARTHVMVRCPICGDSPKHPYDTHCYIDIEAGKPVSHYCHLCNAGGFVKSSFLRALNVNNMNMITQVRMYNNAFRKAGGLNKENWRKRNGGIIDIRMRSSVPVYKKLTDYTFKLDYIANRLGVDFGYAEIPKFRVVLSLADYLKYNGLSINPKMAYRGELIEKDYVGVLSMSGDYIIFRNTKKNKNPRYINYPVFKVNEDSTKAYIIPNEVDIMADDVEFNIAEGWFDILGCFFNVKNERRENAIYVAVCGSGFRNIIKKISGMGFIDNLNLNIYSDNDGNHDVGYYHNIITMKDVYKSLHIYYNTLDKDLGTRKENINLTSARIRR